MILTNTAQVIYANVWSQNGLMMLN